MNAVQVATQIAEFVRDIASAEQKIAYYGKMADSAHKARELAYWTKKASDARSAMQLLQAGQAASTALVPAAGTGTVATTGGTTSGHLIPRVLSGVGRVVTSTAGTVATAVVIGGVLTWVVSGIAGKMSADKPIAPVTGKTVPTAARVDAFDAKPLDADDEYFIYAVNTSGWSLFIGRPSDVEGRKSSSFTDGGTGSQPVEFRKLVASRFRSREAALAHLKTQVTPGKHSVWTGQWVKFGGEEFRIVHVGAL